MNKPNGYLFGSYFIATAPELNSNRRPKRRLHHFVSHSAKEESIRLVDALHRMTMQVFVG
jgi:hypothetical protein